MLNHNYQQLTGVKQLIKCEVIKINQGAFNVYTENVYSDQQNLDTGSENDSKDFYFSNKHF